LLIPAENNSCFRFTDCIDAMPDCIDPMLLPSSFNSVADTALIAVSFQ